MNHLKTRKTAQHTSSSVKLYAPTAWHELNQKELRYALTLMADGYEGVTLKVFILIRFNKIQVIRRSKEGWKMVKDKQVFYTNKWLITSLVDEMKFVERYEDFDARLDYVQGYRAVNELLNGVPFNDYLKMEIAYQMYSSTKMKHILLVWQDSFIEKRTASQQMTSILTKQKSCVYTFGMRILKMFSHNYSLNCFEKNT